MKKMLLAILTILLVVGAAACGTNSKNEKSTEAPEMLEVVLSVNPEKAEPNKPVLFEAKVTQGGEAVKDADEVVFEIWRAKDDKHEKVEIKHAENGIYRLEKSFTDEGTYYIISHVTARDMHNMPRKEFIVGTPSEPEDSKASDSMEGMNKNGHDNDGQESDGH